MPASGGCNDQERLRPLERHVLLPGGPAAGDRPPRLLGAPVRLRRADRDRPAGRGAGHRPDQPVEDRTRFGQAIFPGEVLQAGIGQGYDTATPLQLLNAYAALANGGKLYQPQVVREVLDAGRHRRPTFAPKLIRKVKAPAAELQDHARSPPARSSRAATRTTSSSCRSWSPARPAPPSSGSATARAACRSTNWFVGFVPKHHGDGGSKAPTRSSARPGLRLRLEHGRQRGDRDGQVLPPAPLPAQEDYRRPTSSGSGNFYGGN